MDELQGYYLSVIQKNVHLRFYLSSDMCEIRSKLLNMLTKDIIYSDYISVDFIKGGKSTEI